MKIFMIKYFFLTVLVMMISCQGTAKNEGDEDIGPNFSGRIIRVAYADTMDYTPFDRKLYPKEKNVLSKISSNHLLFAFVSSHDRANVIVGRTQASLKPIIEKHGNSKQYLLWTHEPRWDLTRSDSLDIQSNRVTVANVYNGQIYFNNFYFLDYPGEFDYLKTRLNYPLSAPKSKKAVIMATYSEPSDASTYTQNQVIEDLSYLRSRIGVAGHRAGIIDVFGKGWPQGISSWSSPMQGDWKKEKIEKISGYRFTVAFENTNVRYYVTEKIWDAIYAGTLPIYYGNDWIYETFERGSFIDYNDFNSPEALAKFLKEMTDEEWLVRMKKCIDAYNRSVEAAEKSDILAQTTEQIRKLLIGTHRIKTNLNLVTYGDERFKESRERVRKEALESGFFKQVFVFEPGNTATLLPGKTQEFMRNNKRGGGYWLWKPYIVKKVLQKIPEGEVLIYLDSGSSINMNGGSKLTEYIRNFTEDGKSIFAFEMPQHLEKCWSKDNLLHFLNTTEADRNSGQIMATFFYLVNNPASNVFIENIIKTAEAHNFSLLDDSPSNQPNDSCFKDHRHDQSIFSLSCKQDRNCAYQPDTSWPVDDAWGRGEPFIPTRIKK